MTLHLDLEDSYRFTVDFGDGIASLTTDEGPPLGEQAGPSPSQLLAAAVGNCLASSALFCLRKARIEVHGMRADVDVQEERNEQGRLRISRIHVTLHPRVAAADVARMRPCLDVFEDYCTVSASVRQGIEVMTTVEPDAAGARQP